MVGEFGFVFPAEVRPPLSTTCLRSSHLKPELFTGRVKIVWCLMSDQITPIKEVLLIGLLLACRDTFPFIDKFVWTKCAWCLQAYKKSLVSASTIPLESMAYIDNSMSIWKRLLYWIGFRPKSGPRYFEVTESLQVTRTSVYC